MRPPAAAPRTVRLVASHGARWLGRAAALTATVSLVAVAAGCGTPVDPGAAPAPAAAPVTASTPATAATSAPAVATPITPAATAAAARGATDVAAVPDTPGAPGDDPLPLAAGAAASTVDAAAIEAPAVADEEADRGIAAEPGATCDVDLVEALAANHPGVRQFVTIVPASWSATTARLEVLAFDGGAWVCQLGARTAMVGSQGTRPLPERTSGDDTTPAGVFPLGTQTAWDGQSFQFFGNSPDPGVRGAYRAVQPADCWGATPGASTYQQLYARQGCPGPDDEWLPRYGDVYSHAAVIGANLGDTDGDGHSDVSGDEPGERPLAAAIFLHRHSYGGGTTPRPTSGCVSLAAPDLVNVLLLLDPALTPQFAIGPRTWLS